MKKAILIFLITTVTSIGINQLINSNITNPSKETKIEEEVNFNQNNQEINQLTQEYILKSEIENQKIENNLIDSTHASDVWTEYHWYWFAYWKLHLNHNAISKIIQTASKLGGVSGPLVAKISEFISGLLSSAIVFATAIIIAGFIIFSYGVVSDYSNAVNGCWIGILVLVPGIGFGSN